MLFSSALCHYNTNFPVAAIFGIGTNGAYVEQTENIIKLGTKQKGTQMLVNTELGGFSKVHHFVYFGDSLSDLYFRSLIIERCFTSNPDRPHHGRGCSQTRCLSI